MKIYRDDKEYELTFSEMVQANEEYKLDCMIEDIKEQYENGEYNVELTEEQFEEVARFALRTVSKNDSYYETYWMSVEYTLNDYIDNLPVGEEEDDE